MSAATLLARLTAAGCRVTLRPDGRVSLRPAPAPDLLAEARQHRDELARLIAATTPAGAGAASAEAAAPTAKAPPRPRRTHPSVCLGDPPTPIVDPEAARTLCILELADAEPGLCPDGQLGLAHPERASPDLRATAQLHRDDICALLAYRALLEKRWPIEVEPLPPPSRRGKPL
jgi:hypothetical protein